VGLLQKALASLDGKMAEGSLIVCEFPAGEELPETAGGLKIFKRYKYGKTELAVYR
jgi:16S rRNA G966 N2-methylase RsmD